MAVDRCTEDRRITERLDSLLEAFLSYIVDYRGYSPATARAYERDCSRFIDFLGRRGGPHGPADLTPRDVRMFLSSLSRLSSATIRRTLYGVSAFFEHLVDMEIIDSNPAAPVDPPKVKRTLPAVPSRSQCARLLEACETPAESAVIGLLLMAGLRRSEMLALDVADVAADLSAIRVRGKGGHERAVPLCSELRDHLAAHLAVRETRSPALITNRVGERMQPTTFYRLFRRVLKRAALAGSGLTPHSLRHGFASELVRSGVDIATVSELLGHSNIATTSIYLHSTPETKRSAVEHLHFLDVGHDTGTNSTWRNVAGSTQPIAIQEASIHAGE